LLAAQPTRTVYKCVIAGKTAYSDEPCVGATTVDVTPTRGLNKSTGTTLKGPDVQREESREAIAQAIKPLTGMTAEQLDTAGRRQKLSAAAQSTCSRLDRELPAAEQAMRAASDKATKDDAELHVYSLRKQKKDLRC